MFFVSYPGAATVKVFNKDRVLMHSIGTRGSGDGQLSFPAGLTIDRFSNLVVCACDNSRLQFFTIDGKFVNTIGGQRTGLKGPCSVAVSSTGQMCVIDIGKECVFVYQ